jgi:hypothetical protein
MAADDADAVVERQAEVFEQAKSCLCARLGNWEATVAPV